jgi:hypothetical protein
MEHTMITRRELMATGLGAGAVGGTGDAALIQDTQLLSNMLTELREIRRAVSIQGTEAIEKIRDSQRTHFKNTGRFPQYIEVGYNVFQSVVDWLIAVQQPVTLSLSAESRYAIVFLATTILLRQDFQDNYVGQGFDR